MDFQLTEEQQNFAASCATSSKPRLKPRARHIDETGEFNWAAVKKMGPIGLLGLDVPEEYGGAGVDAVSAAIAIEEIGRGCGSTGLSIAAHNGLGCAPIALFGSEDLKRQFLPAARHRIGPARRAGLDRTRRRQRSGGRRTDLRPKATATSGSSTAQDVVHQRQHRGHDRDVVPHR